MIRELEPIDFDFDFWYWHDYEEYRHFLGHMAIMEDMLLKCADKLEDESLLHYFIALE
mgnify:CR=1 FL=1